MRNEAVIKFNDAVIHLDHRFQRLEMQLEYAEHIAPEKDRGAAFEKYQVESAKEDAFIQGMRIADERFTTKVLKAVQFKAAGRADRREAQSKGIAL
jgi:hypothetical protein